MNRRTRSKIKAAEKVWHLRCRKANSPSELTAEINRYAARVFAAGMANGRPNRVIQEYILRREGKHEED